MGLSAFHAFRTPTPARVCLSALPDAILRQQAAVAAIAARARGAATCLVGIARAEEFQGVIVRPGASLRRGRDLRDRRFGLPSAHLQSGGPRAHALRGAVAALESEGLFFRHMQWVDLPAAESLTLTLPTAYSAEIAALENGLVDAVYVRGPAGLEAARAANARVLVDIGAHRDSWVRLNTALLQVVTVSETLLKEHPQVIAEALLERWPLLPSDLSLDEGSMGALDALKTFMLRWAFIHADFATPSWTGGEAPQLETGHRREPLYSPA